MTKHTPAPWSLGDSDLHCSNLSVHGIHENAHSTIARMVSSEHGMDPVEIYANARLIAAAPELLNALWAMVTSFQAVEYMEDHMKQAAEMGRAAIRKATGGPA